MSLNDNVPGVESAEALAAALMAGAALGDPKSAGGDSLPFVVVPEGYRTETVERPTFPDRPKATVLLRDAASFVRYFNDHKATRSRIFALLKPAKFTAVFDEFFTNVPLDPGLVPAVQGVRTQADWRQFRAVFEVPPSVEWLTWNKHHKHPFGQVEFAEFLLDNLPDVVEPAGSALYDLAVRFEATSGGAFKSHARLQDGSTQLHWVSETSQGSGDAKLPEVINLRIPVFENSLPVDVQARLRFRAKDAKLSIWFELVRPHKVLEQEFRAVWQRIEAETGSPILLGSPE